MHEQCEQEYPRAESSGINLNFSKKNHQQCALNDVEQDSPLSLARCLPHPSPPTYNSIYVLGDVHPIPFSHPTTGGMVNLHTTQNRLPDLRSIRKAGASALAELKEPPSLHTLIL